MIRVNILSVIGAVLALLSVSMPWGLVVTEQEGHRLFRSNYYLTDEWNFLGDRQFIFSFCAVVAGALISFVTPLGFAGPAVGAWSFISYMLDHHLLLGRPIPNPGFSSYTDVLYLGPGLYVAAVASVVTAVAIIFPIWLMPAPREKSHSPARDFLRNRLLSWEKVRT